MLINIVSGLNLFLKQVFSTILKPFGENLNFMNPQDSNIYTQRNSLICHHLEQIVPRR